MTNKGYWLEELSDLTVEELDVVIEAINDLKESAKND